MHEETKSRREIEAATPSLSGMWKMLSPRLRVIGVAVLAICLFAAANLARPIVIQQAIDDGLIGRDGSAIVVASILFLALAFAGYVFQALSTYTVTWVG